MQNLLDEAIKVLSIHGKTLKNIVFVHTFRGDFYPKKDSLKIFLNIEYNNTSCSEMELPEIDPQLKLVGKNFWLERRYDSGYERWEFKKLPKFWKKLEGPVSPKWGRL